MSTPGVHLTPTSIPDVIRVVPVRHTDERGFFTETFRADWFPDLTFLQDSHSLSTYEGTLRGLHFQTAPYAQTKLIRVVRGRVLDVAVDIRAGSPTFGRHVAVELSASGGEQLLVPEGFAHGFVTLEPGTEVVYKVTAYYSASHDAGVRWDDPALGIDWPYSATDLVVSEKDRSQPTLEDVPPAFEYGG